LAVSNSAPFLTAQAPLRRSPGAGAGIPGFPNQWKLQGGTRRRPGKALVRRGGAWNPAAMSFRSITIVPADGRQSETAITVARGTQRLLLALGLSCVAELSLLSGRRADLVALGGDGEIWIVEIKSSVADFRADQKWTDYRMHCDRLFFATAAHVPLDIFPPDAGLILADGYGAELVREAPEHRLHASTRKSVMLAFARAAAVRLQALADPQGPYGSEI
jgi:hypothetical protein